MPTNLSLSSICLTIEVVFHLEETQLVWKLIRKMRKMRKKKKIKAEEDLARKKSKHPL